MPVPLNYFPLWRSAHTITAIIITVPYRARGALSSLNYPSTHPPAGALEPGGFFVFRRLFTMLLQLDFAKLDGLVLAIV